MKKQLVMILALVLLAGAFLLSGRISSQDLTPALREALPEAGGFEQISSNPITYLATDGAGQPLGYVAFGEAGGYGGPLQVAVLIGLDGKVQKVQVVQSKETPVFLGKVIRLRFLDQFRGKSAGSAFSMDGPATDGQSGGLSAVPDDRLDAVTGATVTSRAIADAVRTAAHGVARNQLRQPVTEEPARWEIDAGLLPAILLYLTALALTFVWRRPKARYGTILAAAAVLGFWLNAPLSLSALARPLLGYWPSVHQHLLWYVLLLAGLGTALVTGRNLYCFWLCPFGGVQELTVRLGSGKARRGIRDRRLTRIRFALLWASLILILLYRNPALGGFEPFSTLFGLNGTALAWLLLFVLLVASLFIYRFWCDCFCPVGAVLELAMKLRRAAGRVLSLRLGSAGDALRRRPGVAANATDGGGTAPADGGGLAQVGRRREHWLVYSLTALTLLLIGLVIWENGESLP